MASDQLLRRAGVLGVVPTPLEPVAKSAGIKEIIDMSQVPPNLAARKPPLVKRLLGAVLFKEKVIFVARDQPEARTRFTGFHETGHQIIPWHPRAFLLDHEGTLFKATRDKLEAEACFAAAHLMFQGRLFIEHALKYQLTMAVPVALADSYGASKHAAIRYYVEQNPLPIALVIAGHYLREAGLPIWQCLESRPFRAQFGRLRDIFPSGHLAICHGVGQLLQELVAEAMNTESVPSTDVVIQEVNGQNQKFVAEAYFNRHCLFVCLIPGRSRLLGRRLVLQAS